MLESKAITKKYGHKTAVDNVTLQMEPGHIYGMLGPNGSGKTTWMKMAAGLVKPTAGGVFYNGAPVSIQTRKEIAYLSTESFFYSWMTVEDAGKYYADFFPDFSLVKYHELLNHLELDCGSRITSLSSGMNAKMKIAVTMARDAKVYMLDEPFNGIDLLTRDEIRDTIIHTASNTDKLLLISSHLVEELDTIADRAVFLSSGKLLDVCDLQQLRGENGPSMADLYRRFYGHVPEVQD